MYGVVYNLLEKYIHSVNIYSICIDDFFVKEGTNGRQEKMTLV